MRVIAGIAGGRKLKAVKGTNTRPTADRVKEALFNILQNKISESLFLDLFAGTGSIGIEALSRGAAKAVLIDSNKQAIDVIRENLASTGLEAEVYHQDVLRLLSILGRQEKSFDLIFLDPPYQLGIEEQILVNISHYNLLMEEGIVIVEHSSKKSLPFLVESLCLFRTQKYGDTSLSFYKKGEDNL